jgi:hypothetical protein
MASRLWTFQRILPACEEGRAEGWQAFLDTYTSFAQGLLGVYFRGPGDQPGEIWKRTLRELSANDCQHLRALDHQAEREFLAELRAILLDQGAPGLDPARDMAGPARPSAETLGTILRGLPFLHQQAVFLKLAGYSHPSLDRMLKIPPPAIERAVERLRNDFAAFLNGRDDECLWPAAWLEFQHSLRAAPGEDCPPLRQFARIFDGQASWYDKGPAEEHVTACLHCLERWCALREVAYWRDRANPLSSTEADELLSLLPIKHIPERRRSLLARLFR